MTRDELKLFLENVQQAFYAGDLEALIECFSLPLVVYSAAGVVVLRNEDEFERMVEDYRSAILATSAVRAERTILSCDPLINNRQKTTVRTVDFDKDDRAVTSSVVRYFLVTSSNGYAIEMLEYLDLPLPLEDVEKIVH